MKIANKPPTPRKPILITVGVIILVILAWLAYAHHYQNWPFMQKTAQTTPANTVNYSNPSPAQSSAGTAIKEQSANNAKNQSTTTTPTSSTVAMDITGKNKTTDGNTLQIRTLIQKITSSGSCTLTMTGPGNASYAATAGVQAIASNSTCQGFNVPLAGLAKGTWQIKIDFQDATSTASATTETTL